LGSEFQNVNQVTFRFYITGISTPNATWRNDNVSLWGITSTVVPQTYYADSDGDGYGDAIIDTLTCSAPQGYVTDNTDCDDTNADVNPMSIWFSDTDGDGFGDPNSFLTACIQPIGSVLNGIDCDDNDSLLTTLTMYYVDADGDGFGDNATGVEECSQPQNTVIIGGDCDDTSDQIYPGADEICDSQDNNCDGNIDEGLNFITYYVDADNDGFGTGSTGIDLCSISGPGFSTNNTDCDDSNPDVNSTASDIYGNGIDENCDGVDGYLGIEEVSKIKISINPNPNQGSFFIQLNQIMTNAQVILSDMNGKIIGTYQLNGDSIQISEKNIEKGIYLLRIATNNQDLVERIVVY
jgi:hypothetical protein